MDRTTVQLYRPILWTIGSEGRSSQARLRILFSMRGPEGCGGWIASEMIALHFQSQVNYHQALSCKSCIPGKFQQILVISFPRDCTTRTPACLLVTLSAI